MSTKKKESRPEAHEEEPSLLGTPLAAAKEKILRDTAEFPALPDGDPWGRLRLWEVPAFYHGSIIGVTLTQPEQRELLQKINPESNAHLSDFQIYTIFVRLARERGTRCQLINRRLDEKFAEAIDRSLQATTEEQVIGDWHTSLDTGDLAGPYWAVLTHPATGSEACHQAFIDLQMAAYRLLSSRGAPLGWLKQLEQELCEAREERRRLDARYHRELTARDERINELERQLERLESAPTTTTGGGSTEVDRLKSRMSNLEWRIELEAAWSRSAQEQSERLVGELERLQEKLSDLEKENERLQRPENPPTNPAKGR